MNSAAAAAGITLNKRALFVGGCDAPFHQIEPAEPLVRQTLAAIGVEMDATGIYHPVDDQHHVGDYSAINSNRLADYDALVLFTTGQAKGADIEALLEFVRGGKALVGIHCATDSFTQHTEFIAAIGGKFRTHPAPLDVTVEFVDTEHPITQGQRSFSVNDELYLFNDYDPNRVHLLAETHSFDEGDGAAIPIAWTREGGEGRVFYVSLGHRPEVMADSNWQALVQRGTQWALREI